MVPLRNQLDNLQKEKVKPVAYCEELEMISNLTKSKKKNGSKSKKR